jgi:hypothetical protein
MAEDCYQPTPRKPGSGRTIVSSARWAGKTFAAKCAVKAAAINSPTECVNLYRIDRDTKEAVMDVITADMPLDEIIL